MSTSKITSFFVDLVKSENVNGSCTVGVPVNFFILDVLNPKITTPKQDLPIKNVILMLPLLISLPHSLHRLLKARNCVIPHRFPQRFAPRLAPFINVRFESALAELLFFFHLPARLDMLLGAAGLWAVALEHDGDG